MGLHNRPNIAGFFAERVMEDTKPYDGLLHPSTDLAGCEIATCHRHDPDIPTLEKSQASMTRLLIGTLVHKWIEEQMQSSDWEGVEFRNEVDMTPGLPKGWTGTADVLIGQMGDGVLNEPEWWLADFKTIAGSGLHFLDISKPKYEQHMQASAYYHAAEAMGYKMAPELCILHIPVSAAQYKELQPPIEQWMRPLPRAQVFGEMKRRSRMLKRYLEAKDGDTKIFPSDEWPHPMPKVQATQFNKKLQRTEHVEKPHWLVRFCDSSQCACANQTIDVVSYDESPQEIGASL